KRKAVPEVDSKAAIRGMVAKVPHLVRILEQELWQASLPCGRIRGQHTKQSASAAARVLDMGRQRDVVTRACGPVREAARNADSKAARCHCTGAYRNAASRMRLLGKNFRPSTSAISRDLRRDLKSVLRS